MSDSFFDDILLGSIKYVSLKYNPIIKFNHEIQKKVSELCKPIQQYLQVDFFAYRCIYTDRTVLFVCNDKKFLERRFEHPIIVPRVIPDEIINLPLSKFKAFLWNNNSQTDIGYQLLITNGYSNGLSLYRKDINFIESFHFSDSQNQITSPFYINNIELFEKFAVYFKQNIDTFIEQDKSMLAQVDFVKAPNPQVENQILNNISHFKNIVDLKKVRVQHMGRTFYLTKRELDCLYLLHKGYGFKAIGKKLDLSDRTVEYYINKVKEKSKCVYKTDLIEMLELTPLIDLYELYGKG